MSNLQQAASGFPDSIHIYYLLLYYTILVFTRSVDALQLLLGALEKKPWGGGTFLVVMATVIFPAAFNEFALGSCGNLVEQLLSVPGRHLSVWSVSSSMDLSMYQSTYSCKDPVWTTNTLRLVVNACTAATPRFQEYWPPRRWRSTSAIIRGEMHSTRLWK